MVKERVHEVQRALEGAARKVTFPHFHGNAFGGVPSVWAEALRSREPFHPHAGLREALDGRGLGDQCGVEGKGHVALI